MDYKKLYNEALERAKKLRDKLKYSSSSDAAMTVTELEQIFPQLAESEDERIRKDIIAALKFANDGGVYDKHIAYLEKQKESCTDTKQERIIKAARRILDNWLGGGDDVSESFTELEYAFRDYDGYEEKQKEQQEEHPMPNSTDLIELWDKEEAMLQDKDFRGDEWRLAYTAFLDGFAIGATRQKEQKQEWSEEDEKTLDDAYCWLCEYAGSLIQSNYGKSSMLYGLANKLKSLRPHWKPSEEQMNELHYALTPGQEYDCDVLSQLYSELKKLMEL